MSKCCSSFTYKLRQEQIQLKAKTRLQNNCVKKKKPQQKKIYEKQFKACRNHFLMLLRIRNNGYYKILFKENKKIKIVWKIIKEIVNVKNNSDVSINTERPLSMKFEKALNFQIQGQIKK